MAARQQGSLMLLMLALLGLALSCSSLAFGPQTMEKLSSAREAIKFELKFQNELDNSTIIKRANQQQIFKCQVRLAPIAETSQPSRRVKQSSTIMESPFEQQSQSRWPSNVSLTIEWLKDEVPVSQLAEPVALLSVELKSNSSGAISSKSNDKSRGGKFRLEIKNTSNGGQMKLTSRLKLNQLKTTDSGQYKCVARALFLHSSEQFASSTTMAIELANLSSQRRQLIRSEQMLVSNGAILMVLASNSDSNNDAQTRASKPAASGLEPISIGATQMEVTTKSSPDGGQHARIATSIRGSDGAFEGVVGLQMSSRDNNDKNNENERTGSGKLHSDGSDSGQKGAIAASATTSASFSFEDDEDLFKLTEQERVEFISGNQQQANDAAEGQDPAVQDSNISPGSDRQSLDELTGIDESSSSSSSFRPSGQFDNIAAAKRNQRQRQKSLIDDPKQQQPPALNYLTDSLDSTRLRLAKLVHKITPELSCYTNSGEFYRGNISESADKRQCQNWLQTWQLATSTNPSLNNFRLSASSLASSWNHNHCRNPNQDSVGPWCLVLASRDGDQKEAPPSWPANTTGIQAAAIQYVRRPCAIAPCSEYLWLYIVAPPVGLLLLISCIAAVLARSIKGRRGHYGASKVGGLWLAANGKRLRPKILSSLNLRGGRFAPKKFGSSGKGKLGANGYLDDDIFEIVDDLDWSEGQTQSLSPKSATTESLKLNPSSFNSSQSANTINTDDQSAASYENQLPFARAQPSKSVNPIFNEKNLPFGCESPARIAREQSDSVQIGNRSASQVGPIFATLRCHIRGQATKQHQHLAGRQVNKSSTFIEQSDQSASTGNDWLTGSNSLADKVHCNQSQTNGSHLISCSANSGGAGLDQQPQQLDAEAERYTRASELPQLDGSSFALAPELQPIYEGKFSQVQMAYMRPQEMQQTNDGEGKTIIGHGAQVAVCSLKSNSAIDLTIFKPSYLKLHNLNHLNLLKLIGYSYFTPELGGDEIGGSTNQQSALQTNAVACSLIFDMAQLVDLSDWLKQQNKDSLLSQEPGNDLGTRRNLTCFAKQIALAIDYLHDQNIIYKDLACRNCFLDPTKMLVKVASFNSELVINDKQDAQAQSLKSMIRPKFLLDYYVIDSRPTECQLLPLSWIPLESILFNKFNKQTDVWSFGCLLYELFSLGEVAYFGYSSKQVIDAVRSNLMPPQPLLCPNAIHRLMCKCLSDIPNNRPNVKQIYEQLNLFSGQCSSFLDHHLCSLTTLNCDDRHQQAATSAHLIDLKVQHSRSSSSSTNNNSITKTKSYANIKNFAPTSSGPELPLIPSAYNNLTQPNESFAGTKLKPEVAKIPLSKSINLGGHGRQLMFFGRQNSNLADHFDSNHYDEPVVEIC